MNRSLVKIAPLAGFILSLVLIGVRPALTGSLPPLRPLNRTPEVTPKPFANYRSPTQTHKAIVDKNDTAVLSGLIASGARLIEDYGSFALYGVPGTSLNPDSGSTNPLDEKSTRAIRDDLNLILLSTGTFDTTQVESSDGSGPDGPAASTLAPSTGTRSEPQLLLVQMIGPIKPEWLVWLRSRSDILSYVPNDAYLVRPKRGRSAELAQAGQVGPGFVQWTGPFKPQYKVAPRILSAEGGALASVESDSIAVTVQIARSTHTSKTIAEVTALADSVASEPVRISNYVDLRIRANRESIQRIAEFTNVVWIEPYQEPRMLDERQDQIIAGALAANQPVGPGYLSLLKSKGLDSTPDFVVDIADSGIDRGLVDPADLHKVFLDQSGNSRIAYARFAGSGGGTGALNDTTGHGTLNASILAGYGSGTSFPDADEQGYLLGLGVDPFARLGITKVFDPQFTNPDFGAMAGAMYANGARISSNSWGSPTNQYTLASQIYDGLVRDAQPSVPGNQEMTIVFAAGNGGPNGNISSPGTAKNVISVGASESYNPIGNDGCGVGPSGASDITSIMSFSSGGPVQDGRLKPDIVAPGSHIEGALSQDPNDTASDLCGPKFFPLGQTLYTWSSGTSHSTPAVAGAAALARQYFEQSTGTAPSAAMTKAFLLNSTTYLTGDGAGFNLPGANQGWGLLDLGRAFDGVPRTLVDQTHLLTATGQDYVLPARIIDPSKEVRVTLAWTDAPGSPAANPVVNDLDLQVVSGGQTYLGNYFLTSDSIIGGQADKHNNVEAVWLQAGTTGDLSIRVIAANIAGDGVPGNGSPLDQDFALIVYNAVPTDRSIDSPPTVSLNYPVGGEALKSGTFAHIEWASMDDKGIQSQKVEFSLDGVAYQTIALLDGKAQSVDWLVPSNATVTARIRVTAMDGANLPVASESGNFQVLTGPPDTTPPAVALLSPSNASVLGGGTPVSIAWTESDDVAVVKRVVELSVDGGGSFQTLATLSGPSTGAEEVFQWPAPAELYTANGKIRVTVYDAAGNSSAAMNTGSFQVWALPLMSNASFAKPGAGRGELTITGVNFRQGDTSLTVNNIPLKQLSFRNRSASGDGSFNTLVSDDRKLIKRLPVNVGVNLVAKIARTGQVSAPLVFVRR